MKSHMKVGQNWWEKRVNFQRESSPDQKKQCA